MTTEIGPTERTLAENEAIIASGIDSFIETGLALADVRDREQYREAGYGSFSAYLAGRWPELSRAQAYRAIDTARVAGVLSPIGDKPANEAQARELAPLRDDPEAMREVWQQARAEHGEDLTATDLRKSVMEYISPKDEEPPATRRITVWREHIPAETRTIRVYVGESKPLLPESTRKVIEDMTCATLPAMPTSAPRDVEPIALTEEQEADPARQQPLLDFLSALADAPNFGLLSYQPGRILPLATEAGDRSAIERGLADVRAWLERWERALGREEAEE